MRFRVVAKWVISNALGRQQRRPPLHQRINSIETGSRPEAGLLNVCHLGVGA